MKLLKYSLLAIFSLWIHNELWKNLSIGSGFGGYIIAGIILGIFEVFLKPVIKILLLPINFLTLGLIRLVIDTMGFYIVVFLMSNFEVNTMATWGYKWEGFFAYLATSLSFGIILNILKKIYMRKCKS